MSPVVLLLLEKTLVSGIKAEDGKSIRLSKLLTFSLNLPDFINNLNFIVLRHNGMSLVRIILRFNCL